MSYEPTTWANGDIITAVKLNNIESGVQSVSSSYTPTTWATGDIITAVKLNNIEQGIANAGGGGSSDYPTITATWNDATQEYSYSCDWSFNDVKNKIDEQTESKAWAGVYVETDYDGCVGGTWSDANPVLHFTTSDGNELIYASDGTIVTVQ